MVPLEATGGCYTPHRYTTVNPDMWLQCQGEESPFTTLARKGGGGSSRTSLLHEVGYITLVFILYNEGTTFDISFYLFDGTRKQRNGIVVWW